MHLKRRRLPNFESCSVALFATLALYGPLPSRAQTASPAAPSVRSTPATAPASRGTPSPSTQLGAAPADTPIPPNRWTAGQLSDAFRKADTNGDQRLSRSEAAVWPGLARQFDQVDRDKDGSISSAEFDESLK
jgi:hypothetical protein